MDITQLPLFIVPAIILILVSIGAKFFTVYLAARSQGYKSQTVFRAAFGLSSSGGELALVVAKGGTDVGGHKLIRVTNGWSNDNYYDIHYAVFNKDADYASTPERRFSIRLWRRKK